MHQALVAIFWVVAYVALVIGPLGLMLLGAVPQARGFWTEFAIALGFIGLAQLAIQFALIARFKRITAPYGIDAIMYYHRQIGILTVLIIAAHPLILIAAEPVPFDLLGLGTGSWGSRTGVWSNEEVAAVLNHMLSAWGNVDRLPSPQRIFRPGEVAAHRERPLTGDQVHTLRPLQLSGVVSRPAD